MKRLLAIAALGMMSACASGLSEQDCLNADPAGIGFEDGRNGKFASAVEDRVSECSRYDLPFEREPYRQGWESGNRVFCTPEGALSVALEGRGDIAACPVADYFTVETFRTGREVYRAEQEYEQAESRYENLISTIRNRRSDIIITERKLRDEPDANQRDELADRIRRFRRELREAENDLDYARYDLRRAERAYDEARYELDRLRVELRRRSLDGGYNG